MGKQTTVKKQPEKEDKLDKELERLLNIPELTQEEINEEIDNMRPELKKRFKSYYKKVKK